MQKKTNIIILYCVSYTHYLNFSLVEDYLKNYDLFYIFENSEMSNLMFILQQKFPVVNEFYNHVPKRNFRKVDVRDSI